jgi:hypothetical protein
LLRKKNPRALKRRDNEILNSSAGDLIRKLIEIAVITLAPDCARINFNGEIHRDIPVIKI